MSEGIPCMWMRGGSSKGAYFLAADLPEDSAKRDELLLSIMGSPDSRQIDGIGGGDPLTSKVAIVSSSVRPDADVDYLFLQVFVDKALVSDAQGCGNILAGIAPFALERGLLPCDDGVTTVRVHTVNSSELTEAQVLTPGKQVCYSGDASISGVPGEHAPIPLLFQGSAGSMCGSLLPTGNAVDSIAGVSVTLIDNGMPCVILDAVDLGISGTETPDVLDANTAFKTRLEEIRLLAGPLMNLGDVTDKSVPKMTLVSQARDGGVIATRSLIPHRVHSSIGVMAAVTVATACLTPGSVASHFADIREGDEFAVEHPSGAIKVILMRNADGEVTAAGTVRTARKLFDGHVFP